MIYSCGAHGNAINHGKKIHNIWQFLICLFLIVLIVSLLFLVVLRLFLGHSTNEKLPYFAQ